MTDYRKLVSRKPPVGLLAATSDELDTAGLVYEAVWVQDNAIETMLVCPGRKIRAVRCTCSECGQSAVLDYVPSETGLRGSRYGFSNYLDAMGEVVRDGDGTLCPVCGSPVTVRCAAAVGDREFSAADTTVLSASLLPGAPGERPMVITGWQIRRLVNRHAGERYEVRPMEAYVFEAGGAHKLTGWTRAYSGNVGYSVAVYREWHQPKDWSETWGRVGEIIGLTPELVAESCLPNCKLDVYMAGGSFRTLKSPVAYLRLYQAHPQVENLVVQGCGYLLDRLLDEVIEHSDWNRNRKGVATLTDLHLEESRPAKMLGLTMDEFAVMRDQCWDLYHWRVYCKAKAAGDRMKLPDDMILLHEYGVEDIEAVIGRAPVGKTLRYRMNQMMGWSAANDPYNEYAEQTETVKQNRGKRNCARTPEVEAFETEWLAWIKGGCCRRKDGTPVGAKPAVKNRPEEKAVQEASVACVGA